MAPITAITSQPSTKPVQKADVQKAVTVRDEFSALFEDFVPGSEVDTSTDADLDTSITVAPLQVQPQAQVSYSERPADVEQVEEVAVEADGDDSSGAFEGQARDLGEGYDDGRAEDFGDEELVAGDGQSDNQSTPVEQLITESVDSKEGSKSQDDGGLVARVSADEVSDREEVIITEASTQEPSAVEQPSSGNNGTAEVNHPEQSEDVSEEVLKFEAEQGADSQVNSRRTETHKAPDNTEKTQKFERPARPEDKNAVRADSSVPVEEVVQPKVDNPVFGPTRSERDELSRLMQREAGSGEAPDGVEQPRASSNSPLMDVLMNQVQRLTTQNLSLGSGTTDFNLGSKSTIQLGQSGVAAAVGANLSGRSEADPRSAKIARQFPAAGVKTMERVQKALADAVAAQDGKSISLRLDPPELGQVKVDLSFRGGNLSARIVAESAGVTALLRERAHELQHTLRKLGIEANNVTVSVGTDNEQGEAKTNFDGERQREGQFEQSYLEQEIVESLVVEEGMQSGKVSVDHRVA